MLKYTLRPYQQDCINEAIKWMKTNTLGAVCELSGGSGKSIIIAEVAKRMHELSGKSVLCLVPSAELLVQNCEKLEAIGAKFSIYSASIGKSMRHPIVVSTEGTWKSVAKQYGSRFSTVLVDEGDRTTATLKKIMDDMREENPLIRLCAFTGTPYRLKTGWIMELDQEGKILQEAINPFYKKLIYRMTCDQLIDMGYLTPVQIGVPSQSYDTSALKLSGEDFTNESVKKTFECHESLTQKIVLDIIEKSKDRKGVMIFAATLDHAREIIKYLPQDDYLFVHGEMNKNERKNAVELFKAQKKKYIVNRDILTVGFDATHCDCIALLRATSSNRLFQQIVWRSVRLHEGKTESLLLDYAKNIENLFDGKAEIFSPTIKAYGSKPTEKISVMCEWCGTEQEHAKRPHYENHDPFGFVLDLTGERLDPPIPSHYGRRCIGVTALGKNNFARCQYHWTYKECPECSEKNDVAARKCSGCGLVLINPEDKLSETATFIPVGEQATTVINSMSVRHGEVLHVEWETPHGTLKSRFFPNHKQWAIAHHGKKFLKETDHGNKPPKMITYTKQKTGYCSINEYHQV